MRVTLQYTTTEEKTMDLTREEVLAITELWTSGQDESVVNWFEEGPTTTSSSSDIKLFSPIWNGINP